MTKREELWNHEDFSIIDENQEAERLYGICAYDCPATSGRLISQRFLSQYAY